MKNESPTQKHALKPELSVAGQHDREIRSIGILLAFVVLVGAICALVTLSSDHLKNQLGLLPQWLFGLAALVLMFYLHLASQRRLLSEVSTALIAATAYVDRLEQVSLIDPLTQLFNRRYLDQLFNQQLKWLNRNGRSATLLLFQVLPDTHKSPAEELAIEVALVLRSNFRGSDYVLRNSPDQFLVLLPDTNEDQAQYALNRLAEKLDDWNLENRTAEMALRHELSTCPPGGNLWEVLREVEERMQSDPRIDRALVLETRCGGGVVS